MKKIRVALIGVGNCASALIQGISYYRTQPASADGTRPCRDGLMHKTMCGYRPSDIEAVCAFDIDTRKVGKKISRAIFAKPNCTAVFCRTITNAAGPVYMGRILDGVSSHLHDYPAERAFNVASAAEPDRNQVIAVLRKHRTDLVVNYLPVGSEAATRFYADCALAAGCGFVNCIPVFIASDRSWQRKFKAANLPLIGDDIKSQMGATIVHRALTSLFADRGVRLDRTYQFNMAGNTDFLTMLDRSRLVSKKKSKTESVRSQAGNRIADNDIHIGPSDYVPWLNDNKICFIRMEGGIFGNIPINLELRLSVEDSPNSAGVVIDAIRCAQVARDRNLGGVLIGPSAYFMKSPPRQYPDYQARNLVTKFIDG